jgi:broad specificity phosphatase PhoE
MPGPTKIMIIRHGEKPTIKNQPPFGVTQDGEQDWESLTVRGWLRAAGLGRLFNPAGNQFPNGALDRPALIYASAPRHPGVALEQDEGSKSKRPLQTITPLAQELNVAPVLDFGKGQEADLAKQILARSGVILISWQHEAIDEIARSLVAGNEPKATIPTEWPSDRFDIVWIFDPPAKGKSRWKFTQVPQRLRPGDADTVIK